MSFLKHVFLLKQDNLQNRGYIYSSVSQSISQRQWCTDHRKHRIIAWMSSWDPMSNSCDRFWFLVSKYMCLTLFFILVLILTNILQLYSKYFWHLMHLFGLIYYLSTAWNSPFQNAVFIGYVLIGWFLSLSIKTVLKSLWL